MYLHGCKEILRRRQDQLAVLRDFTIKDLARLQLARSR
jgi:hypothetical protein